MKGKQSTIIYNVNVMNTESKKRRRRARKNTDENKNNSYDDRNTPTGVVYSQMPSPSTNYFSNSSNLGTENLRLQNNLISNRLENENFQNPQMLRLMDENNQYKFRLGFIESAMRGGFNRDSTPQIEELNDEEYDNAGIVENEPVEFNSQENTPNFEEAPDFDNSPEEFNTPPSSPIPQQIPELPKLKRGRTSNENKEKVKDYYNHFALLNNVSQETMQQIYTLTPKEILKEANILRKRINL